MSRRAAWSPRKQPFSNTAQRYQVRARSLTRPLTHSPTRPMCLSSWCSLATVLASLSDCRAGRGFTTCHAHLVVAPRALVAAAAVVNSEHTNHELHQRTSIDVPVRTREHADQLLWRFEWRLWHLHGAGDYVWQPDGPRVVRGKDLIRSDDVTPRRL